jgi:hypothetical protein
MTATEFKYQHYYLNEKTGESFGILAKCDSVTWGKCMISECCGPRLMPMLRPVSPAMSPEGWKEISATAFRDIQGKYVKAMVQAMQEAEKREPGIKDKFSGFVQRMKFRRGITQKAPVKLHGVEG